MTHFGPPFWVGTVTPFHFDDCHPSRDDHIGQCLHYQSHPGRMDNTIGRVLVFKLGFAIDQYGQSARLGRHDHGLDPTIDCIMIWI